MRYWLRLPVGWWRPVVWRRWLILRSCVLWCLHGLEGVVLGKALYVGNFSFEQALEVAGSR